MLVGNARRVGISKENTQKDSRGGGLLSIPGTEIKAALENSTCIFEHTPQRLTHLCLGVSAPLLVQAVQR